MGSSNSRSLLQFWNQKSWRKSTSLFYCLNFERNYGVLKSKSPLLVVEQKVNFSKNETESKKKKKIPRVLRFSSFENSELETKQRPRKKVQFSKVYFFLVFFCSVCILSLCIQYWRDSQNIYTFTYQIAILHTFFCLFLKSSKIFSASL